MATEVKKTYTLDIQGVDSVNDLKSAIEQLTEKLKSLNEQSKEYKDTLQQLTELQSKLADTINGVGDSTSKVNESLKSVKDTTQSATDSLNNMSEASQQTKQNLDNMGNSSTVKELKEEIKNLRDQLVTLQSGSEDYKAVVQELIVDETKLKEVMSAGKNEVNAAEGSYNALSQQMAALKKVWKEVTDEATRNEIGQQIKEVNDKLKEMDYSLGNFQRNVGNYKSALEGLDTEFVSQKRELKDLKLAMEQLDPASQAYADAFNRAAEITHNLADQQERLKYASTDLGDQLGNIRGIASNLAAGYTAVNAAMGLFGDENENVKEALLKVQQTMALVQGLQGLDGFIKRTQGLSTAMKVWIKTSKESAAATQADAAASAADAAAKGAEAAATAGAVAPQLALNAAIKANPIGFIIGLIATLVTVFALLKDKIVDMIGNNEKLNEVFNKIKAVISGFGNIIKKSLINPIKLAIVPVKTLGKVLYDVFTLNWDAIADDIKDGANEIVDITKDTINVIGSFKEGYEKKNAEFEAEMSRKRAEARSKELDDQIKDMEAKLGSDKKYTEEAKKLYEEYFDAKIAMYDKDSDEYKQAVRDKWEYERDYQQKQQEAADKAAKEQAAKEKKAAEEAKKAAEKRLSDFKSAFEKYLPSGVTIEFNKRTTMKTWKKGLEDFKKYLKKEYKDLFKDINFDDVWNKVVADFAKMETSAIKTDLENNIQIMKDGIQRQIEGMDLFYEGKEFASGMAVPDDLLANWEFTFEKMNDLIEDSLLKVRGAKDKMLAQYEEMFSYIEDKQERQNVISALMVKDSSWQAVLNKEMELVNQREELRLQDLKNQSDYLTQGYDKQVETINKVYSNQERYYESLTALRISQLSLYGDRTEEALEYEQEQVMYEMRINNLNNLAATYKAMMEDAKLSAEERKNAEIDFKNTLAAIEDAEVAHTIASNNKRKASWKNTIDYVSTAANGLSTMFGNVATAYESYINQEVEAGRMSEEEAKRRFETVKGVQKAQTLVNTFASAISAFQSMASIPYVGPALGAVAAAAAIAAGMVQVANIDSTTWQGNSSGGGGGKSISSYQLPSVLTAEPQYTQNLTNQEDTEKLANAIGDEMGKQRVYVVESDITDVQDRSRKVNVESTF